VGVVTAATPLESVEYFSPVGRLLLAAGPAGLVRIAFVDVEPEDAVRVDLERIAAATPPGDASAVAARLHEARRALDAYFAGRARTVGVALAPLPANGFRAEVLDALRTVRPGTTVSYTALAAMAGRPRAVRAAASACATNPLPIVIPCHRVVRADGSIGGYLGGLDAKRALLAMEARPRP
jgi:methylated-DNA-[protein]-cysteine S-methyltransferase